MSDMTDEEFAELGQKFMAACDKSEYAKGFKAYCSEMIWKRTPFAMCFGIEGNTADSPMRASPSDGPTKPAANIQETT